MSLHSEYYSKRYLKWKNYCLMVSCFILSSCGDLPDYRYDQSEDYCVMSFPFAGGIIGRQYVGVFRIISTLQYLDDNPTIKVIATGPSDLELEPGSLQKLIIDDKTFKPQYEPSHLEGELQLWGPAFIFNKDDSQQIYKLIQQGHDLQLLGRIEVGRQYDTNIYNVFFGSDDELFRSCINRLLDEEDLIKLGVK
jgi:hypothetical protein